MAYTFCTLFDSAYLSRGLVMYNSIKQHLSDFHVYIFPIDDLCFTILNSLSLQNVTLVSLKDFENADLLKVKEDRTKAEYCWTCTSSTIEYVLLNFNVPSCTYIDADLFFYKSPSILLEELHNEKSVLITEHKYSRLAKYYEQKRAGRFCVQFITFLNTPESRVVLTNWKNQCLKWCYNRYEDGKFGDQKYLDEWPVKYKNVQILRHPGGGVAPWNARQYKIFGVDSSFICQERNSEKRFDLIFYHFHFVRFLENGHVDIGWHNISHSIRELIYYPYIKKIGEAEEMLTALNNNYRTLIFNSKPQTLKERIKTFIKNYLRYNIIKIPVC